MTCNRCLNPSGLRLECAMCLMTKTNNYMPPKQVHKRISKLCQGHLKVKAKFTVPTCSHICGDVEFL